MSRTRKPVFAGLVAMLGLLAACSETASPAPGTNAVSTSAGAAYPVSVVDCSGHTSTFMSAPRRPLTLDPQAYELMFWLGLGEKQLAAGPQPLPAVPDQFKEATKQVKVVSGASNGTKGYIAKEALLAANPDLVIGAYANGFQAPSMYSEDELTGKHINSYHAFGLGGCKGEAAGKPRTSLDSIYMDLTNLGKIFNVSAKADELIARMKKDLTDAVSTVGKGSGAKVTALEAHETLAGTPSRWGASSSVNAIISLAGGVNIFADVSEAYGSTSLEEIVKRRPDVIMLIAYPANVPKGWDDLEKFLTSAPALTEVPAVKNRRFVRVTFPEVGAGGVRNVDGVKKLAAVLARGV